MTPRLAAVAAATILVFALAASPASGQDQVNDVALEVSRIAVQIQGIRARPSLRQDEDIAGAMSVLETRARFFLLYAALREQWRVVLTPRDIAAAREADAAAVEHARTDVQPGATVSSSGTSSLVSKGSGPSFFAAALETGALVRQASATTTTFQGNVVGLFDALGSKGYFTGYSDDSKAVRFMRRISLAFSVRNTNPEAEVLAGDDDSGGGLPSGLRERLKSAGERLEQYSVRMVVGRNRRDPRDVDNVSAFRQLMDTRGQAVLAALDALDDLQTSDEYQAWRKAASTAVATAPAAALHSTIVRHLDALCDLASKSDPRFRQHAFVALQAYHAFASARSTVLEQIEKRPLFAIEYVNSRIEPRSSTLRFIAEAQKGRWDMTANAAVTAHHRNPVPDGPWYRDFQVAVEAARPLGNRFTRGQPENRLGNAVLSAGFLYERLSTSATVRFVDRSFLAPDGDLYIGQLRLTLPMGTSGGKVPLSISFANRSELLDEKQMRANVGFTFNFDAVASLLKR